MTDAEQIFSHRLALQLGVVDVEQINAQLTDAKFLNWIRYYNAEPFGFPREDTRSAQIAAAVMNASPNKIPRQMRELSFWKFAPKLPVKLDDMVSSIKQSFRPSGRRRKRKKRNPE